MNFADTIAQLQWQLEEVAIRSQKNQQQQAITKERIERLEAQIQQQYFHQSQLDQEAITLEQQTQQLKTNLNKLQRIASLSQQFQELAAECQDDQELLHTLYLSVPRQQEDNSNGIADAVTDYQEDFKDKKKSLDCPDSELTERTNQGQGQLLTIVKIKAALPNAEKIYKQMVVRYLEQYQSFQNLIVDELDVIWCSVAFIAFGRSFYRQLSFKHHPDLNGSDIAMQLINKAWEISQDYQVYLGNMNNAS
jgi:chromosome segregation ATPase